MKKVFATLACALFASFAFAGEYPDISITELEEAISKGNVVLLDVNGSSSYEKGHIPGAIDFSAKGDDIAAVLGDNKDKLVVAYCGGPSCSAYKAGAKAAEAAGFTNIKHLSAGISGWLQAGKATEKADTKG
ncbi:MAG: rhodanese-like domain-containing protein [Verrucomicrobiales bacterium]|jgi:rhodanese-related sulfurtransferase|nr:rhodanese-like domain-containing protein [Verrucomicrobiales bacterium]MBP9223703.1 rhodanese-like domain-containing protein [Verrucomicrobiales bacterium]